MFQVDMLEDHARSRLVGASAVPENCSTGHGAIECLREMRARRAITVALTKSWPKHAFKCTFSF